MIRRNPASLSRSAWCCIADVVGETLIVDASSQNHAPDAEGGKDESLLA
jgi:hypothetical protein